MKLRFKKKGGVKKTRRTVKKENPTIALINKMKEITTMEVGGTIFKFMIEEYKNKWYFKIKPMFRANDGTLVYKKGGLVMALPKNANAMEELRDTIDICVSIFDAADENGIFG